MQEKAIVIYQMLADLCKCEGKNIVVIPYLIHLELTVTQSSKVWYVSTLLTPKIFEINLDVVPCLVARKSIF